jgi:hypothetical protein
VNVFCIGEVCRIGVPLRLMRLNCAANRASSPGTPHSARFFYPGFASRFKFRTEAYFLQVKARILQNYFNNSPHSNDNLLVFPGNPIEVARKAPIRN